VLYVLLCVCVCMCVYVCGCFVNIPVADLRIFFFLLRAIVVAICWIGACDTSQDIVCWSVDLESSATFLVQAVASSLLRADLAYAGVFV
jgi:hypothetical protein